MTDQPRPAASLDQMRALLAELPDGGAPGRPGEGARAVLGRLGRRRIERPRLAIFAAAHGVAARLPAAPGPDMRRLIEAILERRAPVVAAAEAIDADLRLYELAWPRPSGDITHGPALDEAACTAAMAYGMVAVDATADLLCLSALGAESAIAAQAIGLALHGGQAADWAAPAAARLIAQAVARHREPAADPFELLRRLGGEDIAAIAGAILAARFAAIPVVLDGLAAVAAAALLQRAAPGAVGHCLITGDAGTPGGQRFADRLGLPAVPGAEPGDGGVAAVTALRAELAQTTS
ncbi:MAG TPA: nicotinate-nucleotide--dimethylbenzimidazole phosphoribosyltransferase [Alphaproteobacteria bacterium]|jgi:nicotinate-nucleotide--dimethylbenzimidazole phosphoribosyltransferase|nr:nicotinate-nucleotide--dimethylbenzimidazole phosphoribosyltransferase [Alphaproteobacteria bacterium]